MMRPLLVHCLHAACEVAGVPVLDVLRARGSPLVCVARRIGVYLAVESGLAIADIAAGVGRQFASVQHVMQEMDRRQQRGRAPGSASSDVSEAEMLAAAKARLGTMMRDGARSDLCEYCRGGGCARCGETGLLWSVPTVRREQRSAGLPGCQHAA